MKPSQFEKLCWLIFWLLSAVEVRTASVAERVQGDETWSVIYEAVALFFMFCATVVVFRRTE